MATLRFPGPFSGYIPAATGVVVGFIRDPKKFPVNQYTQTVKSPARLGVYGRLEKDTQARMVTKADYVWSDGADRPTGNWDMLRFKWEEFQTQRYSMTVQIGDMAQEGAKDTWDPVQANSLSLAQKMMTLRTKEVVDAMETAANWEGNTAAANDLNGGAGTWDNASDDPASPRYNAIRRTLLEAANRIALGTASVVQPEDLVLVVNPDAALRMANTAEIHNFVKYGPFSKEARDGRGNGKWGLPAEYAGFKIVVEDTVLASERPEADGTASARAYVKAASSAVLLSQKGGFDSAYKRGTYATVQIFHVDDLMQVEAFSDPKHRRIEVTVTEETYSKLVVPESGYLISGILP
jgi:hypothetical protein